MPAFLDGGGECGALIRRRDWSQTLGPVEQWPQSLKAATGLLLRSPVPMVMLWGEDGIMLYNDSYSVFAGGKHPEQLGMKVREGWPEVAEFNDHVMKMGLAGQTLSFRDQELTLNRHGPPEQVWMNLDYSPVLGDHGRPAGVLAIVVETTQAVQAKRALQQAADRLRFFDRLSTATSSLSSPTEVMAVTARLLGEQLDASVIAYADMHADENHFTIRGDWAAPGASSIVGTYTLAGFGQTADRKLHAGQPFITRDTQAELGSEEAAAFLGLGLAATVCLPYVKDGRLTALMAAHQASPRNWTDAELSLIAEATERSWAHVERVRDEAVTRESEQRLRLVVDGATDYAILATDPNRLITSWSKGAELIFGYSQEQAIGMSSDELFTPGDQAADQPQREADTARTRGSADDERWHLRADGGLVFLNGSTHPLPRDAAGNERGFIKIARDETERRAADRRLGESESLLREGEERLRLATEAANIGTWDLDPLTFELRCDPRFKELFGLPPDAEVSFEAAVRALHPDDRQATEDAVNRALDVNGPGEYSVQYRTIGIEDGKERWVAAAGRASFEGEGAARKATRFVGTVIDITERKRSEQHQRLLIDELSHRAKNLLAIIQSVAQQSFKNGVDPKAMVASFEGRLGALAAAHGILTRQRWEAAPMRQILCDTITAVKADDHRLKLDGPDLLVPPKTSVSLAMAVHELATNALKYGSFSQDAGTLAVTWRVDGGRLKLEWRERGGPPVKPPSRRGFGSRMIEHGLAAELNGAVRIDFEPEGVVCHVDAPLPEAA